MSAILLAIVLSACQKIPDLGQERQAIMDVILEESENARIGDLEGTMSAYLDDENTIRLYYTSKRYEVSKGTGEITEFLDFVKGNAELYLSGIKISKENPIVKVKGNCAWAICDNIWEGTWEERMQRRSAAILWWRTGTLP